MSPRVVLAPQDRLLLALAVPVFLLCFGLHVHEVARSGLAQLPVWVHAGEGGGPPVLGGYRLETDSSGSGLMPGDRLIRVGEHDLRGVGYIGFDALGLEAATGSPARLVFERDGERGEVRLHPRPRPFAWSRIPGAALFALVSVLVLLRAANRRDARRFFVAFVAYAIVNSQFYGGPAWKTWASLLVWNLGAPVSIFLMLRWASLFPAEVGERLRAPWLVPLLGVLAWLVHRASYLWGGPLPPEWVAPAGQVLNGCYMLATVALLLHNYWRADPIGRRRLKWVLTGAFIATLPLVSTQMVVAIQPEWNAFEAAYALGTLSVGLCLLFVLVAVIRYQLFDVDRLVSATLTTSVLAIAFLAGAFWLLPSLAGWVDAGLGRGGDPARGSGVTQLLLAVGLAGALVPLHRRLSPRIDHFFFPERRAREEGIDQLLVDLGQCASAEEVHGLVGDRLEGLLQAAPVRVFTRAGSRWEATGVRQGPAAPGFPDRGPLSRALERSPRPRSLAEGGLPAAVPGASPAEAAALADCEMLLPLRRGKDLAAVVALGHLRSGDIYTATDRTLLAAVADRASAELTRLRDAETIRYERIRADELARLQAAAERAHHDRSRFLAAASHDLRQPLHALGLYAGLLRERGDGPGRADLADRIQRSAGSLSDMFSALLDVSRLDVGAVEPRPEAVEVDLLLEDLVAELEARAGEKGLRLRWSKSGLRVQSDPVLLARILRNLAVNAIAYTESGEVELAAHPAGDRVLLEVRDTGPGIPPERQAEVFREFVRLEGGSPIQEDTPGLGLGLAIAERLAGVLGHGLALDSEPGRGSTFRVSAPRAREAPRRPEAAGPGPVRFDGRLVVVVDDDTAILEATRALLKGWGCATVVAAHTEDALRGLELHPGSPDALLVDHDLGGDETGEEAIAVLRRSSGREVPAVILTGQTRPEVLDRLRQRGLQVVTKPLTPPRLRALLVELFRRA